MSNHQQWLSNEIETLAKMQNHGGRGVYVAGEGVEGRCKRILIDRNDREKWSNERNEKDWE
jgi:hypothetical protein